MKAMETTKIQVEKEGKKEKMGISSSMKKETLDTCQLIM